MKFLKFKISDSVKDGIIENNIIYEITQQNFDLKVFKTGVSYDVKDVEILCPLIPKNIYAVGLNYYGHDKELGLNRQDNILYFLKSNSSIISTNKSIIKPQSVNELSFEAELAIVIKKQCKNVSLDKAKDYIFGYTIINDITARDIQKKESQWTRSKSFDTFCPIGPWIETDLDIENKNIQSILNGQVMQNDLLDNMINNPYEIVSYISKQCTLYPGDVISTGTPVGVGNMDIGDEIVIAIDGIGVLSNKVVGEKI